jgi:predicted dehydrogenase
MTKLGVGVVGVGVLGRRHAENLRKIGEANLVAVADSNAARAAQVAAELGVGHHCTGVEALAARKDVQAIVIASPSRFHAEAVRVAAEAGKHVFCEKPLALSMEDAEKALAAVDKAGVQLQMGFMRRYDPAYVRARRRIEAGEIGEPIIFKSTGRDKLLPPLGFLRGGVNGTIFVDSTIHEFDLARWLMQDEVAELQVYARPLRGPDLGGFEDLEACLVNLRFAGGAIGNVESLRQCQYGYDIHTEIVGTKGTLRIGYLRQTAELVLSASGAVSDVVDHWLARFADAYWTEMQDFVHTLLRGGRVAITGEDGRRALACALAAQRSYEQARPVAV